MYVTFYRNYPLSEVKRIKVLFLTPASSNDERTLPIEKSSSERLSPKAPLELVFLNSTPKLVMDALLLSGLWL